MPGQLISIGGSRNLPEKTLSHSHSTLQIFLLAARNEDLDQTVVNTQVFTQLQIERRQLLLQPSVMR